LLEEDAPEEERKRLTMPSVPAPYDKGEADQGELAIAVSDWLGTLKDRVKGHDRFQLAVARNALGMIGREARLGPSLMTHQRAYCDEILAGKATLEEAGMLAKLKADILDKVQTDVPKYPALAVARERWTGEN